MTTRRLGAATAVGVLALVLMVGPAALVAAAEETAGSGSAGTDVVPAPESSSPDGSAGDDADGAPQGRPYPGDGEAESLLVAQEERRLVEVRSIANGAQWTGVAQWQPYRLETGTTYTLVLVARDAPYTFDDLLALEPQTLVRQPDGSYLLGENIIVEEGATLEITAKEGLTLHLSSTPSSFVSIVTLGGDIVVKGSPGLPVTISSWDPTTGEVDSDTTDGRAYLRVIGGFVDLQHATFDHLGFWSGTTGGLSLTGTELPDQTAADEALAAVPDGTTPALTDTPATAPDGTAAVPEPATVDPVAAAESPAPAAAPQVFGKDLLPTDAGAQSLALQPNLSGFSYVSANIYDVTFSNNAFGLFVTNAQGVVVSSSRIQNSLVDGLVMHRDVSASSVTRTVSTGNAVDGFKLARATSGIVLSALTASDNGRNGVTIEGAALADGPSATGTPVTDYGNNEVSDSRIEDNGRYGVDVVGGVNIVVDGNTISGSDTGIVVSDGTTKAVLKGNIIDDVESQGIALRAAGTDAVVEGNDVSGGEIGIYARDSGGVFQRNTIDDVTNHAFTLVGTTGTSTITKNIVSGRGPSAIDVARTDGVTVSANTTDDWNSTKPLSTVLRQIFQPLTVVWLVLALLVLVTAASGLKHRRAGIRHPYADKRPLTELTLGVVDPDEVFREYEETHQPVFRSRQGSHVLSATESRPVLEGPEQAAARQSEAEPVSRASEEKVPWTG